MRHIQNSTCDMPVTCMESGRTEVMLCLYSAQKISLYQYLICKLHACTPFLTFRFTIIDIGTELQLSPFSI